VRGVAAVMSRAATPTPRLASVRFAIPLAPDTTPATATPVQLNPFCSPVATATPCVTTLPATPRTTSPSTRLPAIAPFPNAADTPPPPW